MSLTAAHLTRKLSGRARVLFAELTAAELRERAGEGMDEAAQAHYRRRLDAMPLADRRKLEHAYTRWRAQLDDEAAVDGPAQEAAQEEAQQAADDYRDRELDALTLLRGDLPRYLHAVAAAAELSVPAVKELAAEVLHDEGPEDRAVATRLSMAQQTGPATWRTLIITLRDRPEPATLDVHDADSSPWALDDAGSPLQAEVFVGSIVPERRAEAIRALLEGDLVTFFELPLLDPLGSDALGLLVRNLGALQARGLFEPALAHAYRTTRPAQWPRPTIAWLFGRADLDKLRACGDRLRGPGPYRVFRGGRPGVSWTPDIKVAAFFAARSQVRVLRAADLAPEDVLLFFRAGWYARTAGHARPAAPSWRGIATDEYVADVPGELLPQDETERLIADVSTSNGEPGADDPGGALSAEALAVLRSASVPGRR